MIHRTVVLCLVVLSTATGFSRADYWHGDFTDGSALTLSDGAVVYEDADTGSASVDMLPAGTEVEITGSGGDILLENGTATYWYSVSVPRERGVCEGWMTGTSLALAFQPLGGDTLFLYGITGYDPGTCSFSSAARVLVSGRMVSEIVFSPPDGGFGQVPYSYSVRSAPAVPEGLRGLRDIVRLSFIYEACGFLNRDILLCWTGDELIMGPSADSQFEASEYRFVQSFVLPADSSGRPEEVRVLTEVSQWEEGTEDYVLTDTYSTVHAWDGSGFIEH